MKKSILTARWACLLPVMGLLAIASSASAAVTLTPAVIFDAGTNRFTYNYSVMNSASPEEIITIVLPVSKTAALLGLTAPAGFVLNYDTFQGLVNFDLDANDATMQTFAPNSTVGGFSFTSPVGPSPSTFTARDVNMDFTGITQAPIPEPSAFFLGLASLGVFLRRRR